MTSRYWDAQLPSYRLLPLLGLKPHDPIPPDLEIPPTLVDGLMYRVRKQIIPGRKHHRVQVECPCCKTWWPAGRLLQHLTAHR